VRVAHVFARRGYNIDSLVVSPGVDPSFSRMTITAKGNIESLDQIIKQAAKLVDVISAGEHNDKDAVHNELTLIKIKLTPTNKPIILKLVKKFDARIIEQSEKSIIIAQVGTTNALDELASLLRKYGIIEVVRSGKLVMAKGKEIT
jgi:acetolactate synthase small subunit